jgi:hypothetical protein
MGLEKTKGKVGTYPLKPGTYPLLKNNLLYQKELHAAEKWVRVTGGMNGRKGVEG